MSAQSTRKICLPDILPLSLEGFPAEGPSVAWHQVAVEGSWQGHWQGPFSITPDTMRQMAEYRGAQAIDPPVDYEHASLFADRSPAAGWIKSLDQRKGDDGSQSLWAQIEWTDAAADHIRAREYRYLSPTIVWNTRDRKSGKMGGASLHSVALTNKPFLHELPEVRLNKDLSWEDDDMDELLTMLGLDDQAQLAPTVLALQRFRDGICDQLKIKDRDQAAAVAEILSLQNPSGVGLAADLAALREQLAQRDARDAVSLAQREGKITADGTPLHTWALECALKAPAMFAGWAASAAKIVPVEPKAPPAPGPAGLTPEELNACRASGMSPEDFVKYNSLGDQLSRRGA